MVNTSESLIPEANLSIEQREDFKHALRVTIFGGLIENENLVNSEMYEELGKILSEEGVILSTGPILKNTFVDKITSQFIEEEKAQIQSRKGKSSPRLIEFIPTRRTAWIAQAEEREKDEKYVKTVEGGVPLLTAALERPQTGLFIFCQPSLNNNGTLAEATQAIAQMEVIIKTNQTIEKDETKARSYPILPKALFIDWSEKDKRVVREIISRSDILTPPNDPQKYSDLIMFLKAEEIPTQLHSVIAEQTEKFDNWFKTHRTTLAEDF